MGRSGGLLIFSSKLSVLWCPAWLLFRALEVFRDGGQRPGGYRGLLSWTQARWLPDSRKRRDRDPLA